MEELSFLYLDALNMMNCYDGLHRIDLFIMSINSSIVRELEDEGYCRSGWLTWHITHKGLRALEEAGIETFGDTRR